MGRLLINKTTDILIGISLHTIDTWVEAGFPPSQIHYVPNGVDFQRFNHINEPSTAMVRKRLGLPEDRRILLWVGRLHRGMKGSDRVERVAGMLPDDTVLVVVGNGPEYEGMVRRNKDLIDSGALIMVGSTSRPERYYAAADLFLFTSYHEPFGLVLLEAVASGLPIMAFPVREGGGAVALLNEFGAVYIDDADSDSQLRARLADAMTQASCATVNRARVMQKYSWKSVADEVAGIYALALNKKL